MKLLIPLFMCSFILYLCESSCTKEAKEKIITTSAGRPVSEFRFLATDWEQGDNKNFVCSLRDIMNSRPDATTMKVFVLTDTAEMLISSGQVSFMNGKLWSEESGADLNVIYHAGNTSSDKPFDQLSIKIVFSD